MRKKSFVIIEKTDQHKFRCVVLRLKLPKGHWKTWEWSGTENNVIEIRDMKSIICLRVAHCCSLSRMLKAGGLFICANKRFAVNVLSIVFLRIETRPVMWYDTTLIYERKSQEKLWNRNKSYWRRRKTVFDEFKLDCDRNQKQMTMHFNLVGSVMLSTECSERLIRIDAVI